MTEYFCRAQSKPSGLLSTTHLVRIQAQTPREAIDLLLQRQPDSGWYAIWISDTARCWIDEKTFTAQWLSAWAQTRLKGVRCINCRGATQVIIAHANIGGFDEHHCKKCDALVLVDKNGAMLQIKKASEKKSR